VQHAHGFVEHADTAILSHIEILYSHNVGMTAMPCE
jgi:hypothetical protein